MYGIVYATKCGKVLAKYHSLSIEAQGGISSWENLDGWRKLIPSWQTKGVVVVVRVIDVKPLRHILNFARSRLIKT